MNSDNLLVNGIIRSVRYEHGGVTFSTYNYLFISVYMCWDYYFFRLILIHFYMTVYMWCVCYVCLMFYHCIIMNLDIMYKHFM